MNGAGNPEPGKWKKLWKPRKLFFLKLALTFYECERDNCHEMKSYKAVRNRLAFSFAKFGAHTNDNHKNYYFFRIGKWLRRLWRRNETESWTVIDLWLIFMKEESTILHRFAFENANLTQPDIKNPTLMKQLDALFRKYISQDGGRKWFRIKWFTAVIN